MSQNNRAAIQNYLSVLDKMRKNYSPLVWWGSFVASKDRFYSEIQHQYFSDIERPVKIGFAQIFKMPFYLLIEGRKIVQTKKHLKTVNLKPGEKLQIIKSFAYEHSVAHGEFKDPMFEGLAKVIGQNTKAKTITIYSPLGNLTKIIDLANKISQDIFPIYYFCKSTDIFIVLKMIFSNVVLLLMQNKKNYNQLELKIHKQLLLSQFSYMNILGLIHYLAFKNLIHHYEIKKLIYTYENNVWEKLTLIQLRKNSPTTSIIGHLHSAVPEAALNFFISETEDKMAPLPDKIVTTGTTPAEILQEYGAYTKTKIEVGGSFKYATTLNNLKRVAEIKKTILIGMEGIPQSLEMVNYTLSELEKISDWKVILRTHPILPIEEIKDKLNVSKSLSERLEFSGTNKLADDFARSGVMIYWGSTLCFEAIVHGVPLINYRRNHLLNFDPLFKLAAFKKNTSAQESLSAILNKIIQTPVEKMHQEQDQAYLYVRSYFHENNDELIMQNYGR